MALDIFLAAPRAQLDQWRSTLTADPRCRVIGTALDRRELRLGLAQQPAVMLLAAELVQGVAELQQMLADQPATKFYILLPDLATPAELTAVQRLPGCAGVFQGQLDLAQLVTSLTDAPADSALVEEIDRRSVNQSSSPQAVTHHIRLGFYGTRGGVGVSTAVVTCAKLLAEAQLRVALFDATARGDLHLMLGCEPQAEPLMLGLITIFMGQPDEERAAGYPAILVDGGRQQRLFNVEWLAVEQPLTEETLRRLVGLEVPSARALSLGRWRVEVEP
jgi:hypothetical protein